MNEHLLSRANSSEVSGVASRFNDVIEQAGIDNELLTQLNNKLAESNKQLTASLNRKLNNDDTPRVWELETLRDRGLKAFFNTVKGGTFRLNDEFSTHAEKIYEVIKRHGLGMYRLPHVEQTATMNSMFDELSKAEFVTALQTTNTQVLLDEIKEANENFLTALNERSEDTAAREEIILLVVARTEVREGLEQTQNYVSTISEVINSPEIKTLKKELAEIISKANSNIKARIKRGDNGE